MEAGACSVPVSGHEAELACGRVGHLFSTTVIGGPLTGRDLREEAMTQLRAVVTGASSGIGASTVEKLTDLGWSVVALARREDRLKELAAKTGCDYLVCDVADDDSVARAAEQIIAEGPVHALVANAGLAIGNEWVENASPESWAQEYNINVLGILRSVRAFLPALEASGRGDILLMGSTAGLIQYEGGGGYVASKHGVHAVAGTLRLELAGRPVRVMEIAPGMVATPEFSLKRMGSQEAADTVYEGVENPLTEDDIADAVVWSLTRPHHVNVDLMVLRPIAQAAQHKVVRNAGL